MTTLSHPGDFVLAAEETAPTGSYLIDRADQDTEAVKLSVAMNETLLTEPTNMHVNKVWRFYFNGMKLSWTTPDRVFHDLTDRDYFRHFLSHQYYSTFVDPKNLSSLKFKMLKKELRKAIQLNSYVIPHAQASNSLIILNMLSKDIRISPSELKVKVSIEREISISKTVDSGTHLIIVGDSINDITYLFTSNQPGVYTAHHITEGMSLKKMIELFIAA